MTGRSGVARWGVLGAVLLVSCGPRERRLDRVEIESAAMGDSREIAVYLPPDWRPEEALPLVVFLHGGGDSPDSFDRFRVGQALDAALEAEGMPRVVVAVPRGDLGMWTNWADGSRRYEDWVIREVIPEMQRRYGTRPCPEGCHLAGVSMGGAGALRMAHHHRGLFASVSSLSGIVLSAEEVVAFSKRASVRLWMPVKRIFGRMDDPEALRREDLFRQWRTPADVPFRLYLGWGTEDSEDVVRTSRAFADHLERNGIPFRREVYAGCHGWEDWRAVIPGMIGQAVDGGEGPAGRSAESEGNPDGSDR
jgi:enterochelin esterase-like enzyme